MSAIIIIGGFILQIVIMIINIFLCMMITKRRNEYREILNKMHELNNEQKQFWKDLERGRGLN